MESKNNKTIYVSNLPTPISEEDLMSIFGSFGVCVSCQLDLETSSAYIEFDSEQSAEKALAMHNTPMDSNQMNVVIAYVEEVQNSAPYFVASKKVDYSTPIQIFVGGIGFDIDESKLKDGFSHCGQVVDAKVVRGPDGQHKGFAFVSFTSEEEASSAIQAMNNTMFHNRKIQCNWATKSKNGNGIAATKKMTFGQPTKTLEEISYEAPETNTSVYVMAENLSEDVLRPTFERFGKIKNIKAFPEKNHAFVNYDTHDAAAYAIQQLNGYKINNIELKCNWGKKNATPGITGGGMIMNKQFGNQINQYYDNSFDNYQQQFDQYCQPNFFQVPQFYNNNNNSQMGSFYNNNNGNSNNYQQYPMQFYQQQQQQPQANFSNNPNVNFINQPNLLGQPKISYGGHLKSNLKAIPKAPVSSSISKPRMNRAVGALHPYNKQPKLNNNNAANQFNSYQQQ